MIPDPIPIPIPIPLSNKRNFGHWPWKQTVYCSWSFYTFFFWFGLFVGVVYYSPKKLYKSKMFLVLPTPLQDRRWG